MGRTVVSTSSAFRLPSGLSLHHAVLSACSGYWSNSDKAGSTCWWSSGNAGSMCCWTSGNTCWWTSGNAGSTCWWPSGNAGSTAVGPVAMVEPHCRVSSKSRRNGSLWGFVYHVISLFIMTWFAPAVSHLMTVSVVCGSGECLKHPL